MVQCSSDLYTVSITDLKKRVISQGKTKTKEGTHLIILYKHGIKLVVQFGVILQV